MRLRALLVLLAIPAGLARAGGPEMDAEKLAIGSIIATADEIILHVDGGFRLFTDKAPGEDPTGGNAKWVPLAIRDGVLRIPRRTGKHPGGDAFETYTDWNAYQKAVMGLEGKEVSVQMWNTQTIFRGGQAREIIAEACKFGKVSELPPSPEPMRANLVIDGAPVALAAGSVDGVVEKALALLASCSYRNASPGKRMEEPMRKSHLQLLFPDAKSVEVKASKETVRVEEMVLTFPLSSGGIWVRTNREVIYFAKFQHALARELTQRLPETARK